MYGERISLKRVKNCLCCSILTQLQNNRYLEIYNKVFDEHPSFRSFNFLNYIEEKGLGDLSTVFTKAKELKHNIRIRNIMNFFFNFENIEQIYEKELLLDAKSKELEKLPLISSGITSSSSPGCIGFSFFLLTISQ